MKTSLGQRRKRYVGHVLLDDAKHLQGLRNEISLFSAEYGTQMSGAGSKTVIKGPDSFFAIRFFRNCVYLFNIGSPVMQGGCRVVTTRGAQLDCSAKIPTGDETLPETPTHRILVPLPNGCWYGLLQYSWSSRAATSAVLVSKQAEWLLAVPSLFVSQPVFLGS
jgi:hypothetical protein